MRRGESRSADGARLLEVATWRERAGGQGFRTTMRAQPVEKVRGWDGRE